MLKYNLNKQTLVNMANQKIKNLVESIKRRQLKGSYSYTTHSFYSLEECQISLKATEKTYDELLLQSLELIDLLNDAFVRNGQQLESLTAQLEGEKLQRSHDMKELYEVVHIQNNKINELKSIISLKEQEIGSYRAQAQQKDYRIHQIQAEQKENFLKLENIFTEKLKQQEKLMISNHEKDTSHLNLFYQQKLRDLALQNQQFLQQNQLLSTRLDQIMKYVEELENSKLSHSDEQIHQHGQLQPQIIDGIQSRDYSQQSSPRIRQVLRIEEDMQSIESKSPQRMVLHEILNTEDRKSINFGDDYYSKTKQFLQSSNDENNLNILNLVEITQQKPRQEHGVKIIHQFNQAQLNCQKNELDPYQIFFTLICQCAKINSGNLEEVAGTDLSSEWSYFLEKRIPLHEWQSCLIQKLRARN